MNTVYCTNGHYIGAYNKGGRSWQAVVSAMAEEEREDAPHRAKFCATCGAKNLSACEHCDAPIRPVIHGRGRPSYCVECAEPFPWTAIALAAAKEYTDELDTLTDEDKALLKDSFADLTVDTARTPLAASRFKKMVAKAGPVADDALIQIITGVLTEVSAKLLHIK